MTLTTILVVILVLLLIGALPVWPHASRYGYGPSGVLFVLVIVLLVLILIGKVPL